MSRGGGVAKMGNTDRRTYIADANAQRKYEDGKALNMALKELRAEIARIASDVL